MESPPLTPIHQYMSHNINTSPRQRRSLSRRSSSYTSSRSPEARRHRLSNASRGSFSNDDFPSSIERSTTQKSGPAAGRGNLADELDFADDDEDYDDEHGADTPSHMSMVDELNTSLDEGGDGAYNSTPFSESQFLQEPTQTDGARDSGIDVGYQSSPSPSMVKFSSGPLRKQVGAKVQREDGHRIFSRDAKQEKEADFSIELDEAMDDIAKLANPTISHRADTMARTLAELQNLGPQTTLETQSHRLATSMNSMSANLVQQSRTLTSLSSTLFSPFAYSAPLSEAAASDLGLLISELVHALPVPDNKALQSVAKLDRETQDLSQTLSGLLDSLQVGKQASMAASRHLKVTQTMVSELKRDRERADEARFWIEREGWDRKLEKRSCASACGDVVGGFEEVCAGLRRGIEDAAAATAAPC